ncbi:rhodanese-like domain-containing protein [Mycetocola sp. 2940]|uniref:sulfurtransferase n=1 Tax=Mycetocola sp. 2940 TaxID=3156452 RepID=UPI003397B2DE
MPPVLSGPTVTTQWLADHLGSDDLVILDGTVLVVRTGSGRAYLSGYDRYLLDGHIPGAVFADQLSGVDTTGNRFPVSRQDAAEFERVAASVGVSESSVVVVYDSTGGGCAARLWELFRRWGFTSIAVLDGGLPNWLAEGRDTDTGRVEPTAGSVVAVPQPEEWAHPADVDLVLAAGHHRPRGGGPTEPFRRVEGHTSSGTRQVKFSQR